MASDVLEKQIDGPGHFTPMEIAQHPLFNAREKIEMLERLKAELTAEKANPDALGFDPKEIDRAIEEVKLAVETGEATEPVSYDDL